MAIKKKLSGYSHCSMIVLRWRLSRQIHAIIQKELNFVDNIYDFETIKLKHSSHAGRAEIHNRNSWISGLEDCLFITRPQSTHWHQLYMEFISLTGLLWCLKCPRRTLANMILKKQAQRPAWDYRQSRFANGDQVQRERKNIYSYRDNGLDQRSLAILVGSRPLIKIWRNIGDRKNCIMPFLPTKASSPRHTFWRRTTSIQ